MKWPEYALSQLSSSFISGGTPSTKVREYWEGKIPWITGSDIVDGEVSIGRRYINESAVSNSATNIVPERSLLMVTRTGVGKIAIAPVDIAISQDLTGIVLKKGIDPKFALAAIRSRMGILLAAQRGATIKGVTRDAVKRLAIPLPPLSEQHRIVEILDQADALRKKRAEADAKAARILPALFYEMFGDPATNPKGWPIALIGELCDVVSGATPRTDNPNYWRGSIKWATPKDLSGNPNFVITETERSITDAGYASCSTTILPVGAILLSSRAPIGLSAIAGIPLCTNQGFKNLIIRDRLDPWYLLAWLRLRSVFLDSLGRGATFKEVSKSIVESIRIPVPPLEKQKAFASKLQIIHDGNFKRRMAADRLNTLYCTILHRAFAGDLTAKWREAHMKELLAEMEQQAKALEAPPTPAQRAGSSAAVNRGR